MLVLFNSKFLLCQSLDKLRETASYTYRSDRMTANICLLVIEGKLKESLIDLFLLLSILREIGDKGYTVKAIFIRAQIEIEFIVAQGIIQHSIAALPALSSHKTHYAKYYNR